MLRTLSLLADAALAVGLQLGAALALTTIAPLILHALTFSDLRPPTPLLHNPCCVVGLERSLVGVGQTFADAAPLRFAAQLRRQRRQRRQLERLRGLARSSHPGRTCNSSRADQGPGTDTVAYKFRLLIRGRLSRGSATLVEKRQLSHSSHCQIA